ncbi:MAG TPA: murein transglycosylase A [Burkholderiaceae bacterium]|jgi:membrane-bound lytic murein transglycosylase A|nr:murein transglycosylase A [Burkholderiaceae bacterium]
MSLIRTSLLASAAFVVISLSACTTTQPEKAPIIATPVAPPAQVLPTPIVPPVTTSADILRARTFAAMPGWGKDDLREAWAPFLASCIVLSKKTEWKEPCAVAQDVNIHDGKAIRDFFEAFFQPYQVFNPDGSEQGLVTGYYEPLLRGARRRGGSFQTPLYRTPDDLLDVELSSVYPELKGMRLRGRLVGNKIMPYPSRAELMQSNALNGKELLWVDDSIEAFFLQVQGSGRVQLTDTKETVRVAYADQNGYPYKSIGRYLVDRGELTLEQASAQSIKAWVATHPAREQELLNSNPSYVFFKEEKVTDPNAGPKGSLGVPLTPQRSIAVDTQYIPLGVPVYLATTQPNSDAELQRLMLAQDTGGAIRNAVRADFFWGFGSEAQDKAGKMKQRGMMWVLLPKQASTTQ